jgi:hypothetical protein
MAGTKQHAHWHPDIPSDTRFCWRWLTRAAQRCKATVAKEFAATAEGRGKRLSTKINHFRTNEDICGDTSRHDYYTMDCCD